MYLVLQNIFNPSDMHNFLTLELPYKGASFPSFIMKAGSHVYKVIHMKRIHIHIPLSLTNIYGMLEIMEKQFQCYEVQRTGMRKLLAAHYAAWNDNHPQGIRVASSTTFKGYHETGWKCHEWHLISNQRFRACKC